MLSLNDHGLLLEEKAEPAPGQDLQAPPVPLQPSCAPALSRAGGSSSPLPTTRSGVTVAGSCWLLWALQPAAPLFPAPLPRCVRSFLKNTVFCFNIFVILIMEEKKNQQPFRLSNGCKLFKYTCPWNKNTVSVVCCLPFCLPPALLEEKGRQEKQQLPPPTFPLPRRRGEHTGTAE